MDFFLGLIQHFIGVVAQLRIGADVARQVEIDHQERELVEIALGVFEGLERGLEFLLPGELVALAGEFAASEADTLVDGGENAEDVEARDLVEVDALAGLTLLLEGEVDVEGFHLFGGFFDAVSCGPGRPLAELDEGAEDVVIFLRHRLPHEPLEDVVVGGEDVRCFLGFRRNVCVVAELEVETDFCHKFLIYKFTNF